MVIKTPPMGWNSWNTFGQNVNEDIVIKSIDTMASSGLLEAGYNYIVIDDCWSLKERVDGKLVADPEKFPHGMKYIADYAHSKGLKFGMYSCAAHITCAMYPGSYDYEFVDAATFAEWGVDFLKYDYCFHPAITQGHYLYKRMGLALANCGRDILFSACCWGQDNVEEWIKSTGAHMWRSTEDIVDTWESVKRLAMSQYRFQKYNGQGCFNDIDMLVVGMNGAGNVASNDATEGLCGYTEYKTHFSFWAFLNSPLMIGCDITNMDDKAKEILTNKDIIAINQDPAQRQPFEIYHPAHQKGGQDTEKLNSTWAKFLDNGDIALGMFNFGDTKGRNYIDTDVLGLPISSGKTLELTELWTGEKLRIKDGLYITTIEPHESKVYRARVVDI